MAESETDRHQMRGILRRLVIAILGDIREEDWDEEVQRAIEQAEKELEQCAERVRLGGARQVLYARLRGLKA